MISMERPLLMPVLRIVESGAEMQDFPLPPES